MKLTKLMVLALVLALFVCAFVACGGTTDTETQAPETQAPETQAPDSETEAPGEDTEAECAHEIVVDEKAATCSDRGYKKETCKLCGEVISETAYPKTAHTASGAATCDTDSKCTVCGEVLEAAKGHVWGEVTTTAATCTAAGKETKTCTVCNKTDVKELATLAHVIEKATAFVPATCTTEGSKTGVCSLCGQTQTVVLPAAHVVTDLGDLSALSFVDGKIQAKCTACEAVVDVTAEVRFALSFDEADVATELAKYGEDFKYVIVYNADQAGTATGDRVPVVKNYPDAADGHTSVLATIHNSSPAITFKGELLADADYYVISFDWRATKYGNNTNKIGAFGQAAKAFEGVAGEGDMVYAFKVDRSNGDLYDHSGKNKFGSAPAEQWYKVIVVVDNESGTAYTYVDGVCVATTQNAKWQVVEGGEYTWRFGGIYNVFHVPEFDNFEVVAIQKSVTEVGPSVDGGDEEEGDEEDDGTGCAHQCYLEYQLPTPTTPGFIKRTCLICGRVVTFEVLDHQCTPNVPADCVTSSYCTECGALIEAAWGHNFDGKPEVIPADPACSGSGTRVGKCTVCGDVKEEVEPAAHTFKVADLDLANLTFDENGNVVAKCSVCGQTGAISAEEVFALDFDKEVGADLIVQSADTECKIVDGKLYLEKNKCPLYYFDAEMLNDADVYVISFDYGHKATSGNTTVKGIFGLVQVNTSANEISGDKFPHALWIQRGSYQYAKNSSNILSVVAAQSDSTLDKITIVVDNASGYSYVYINGTYAFVNQNKNMLVAEAALGEGNTYAWRFGGEFNLNIGHVFDNFSVTVLDAECRHTVTKAVETAPATCTAPGSANTVCAKCDKVLGSEVIDMIAHVPGTVTDANYADCAYKAVCTVCETEQVFAVENAAHALSTDAAMVSEGGKVYGTCENCGLTNVAAAETELLALNFDKADVATELAALPNAETYGFAYGTVYGDDAQASSSLPTVVTSNGRTILRVSSGSGGKYGNHSAMVMFNGDMMKDSDYYVVSFDLSYEGAGISSSAIAYQSLFALAKLTSSEMPTGKYTVNMADATLLADRLQASLSIVDPSKTAVKSAKQNEWYTVTILVNNTTGNSDIYIDDVLFATTSNGKMLVEEGNWYVFMFGGSQYNNQHRPAFDNFRVYSIDTATLELQ